MHLVIRRGVPFELAKKIEQALLLPACDEFLQRDGDRSLLGALPAELQRPLDELGIY